LQLGQRRGALPGSAGATAATSTTSAAPPATLLWLPRRQTRLGLEGIEQRIEPAGGVARGLPRLLAPRPFGREVAAGLLIARPVALPLLHLFPVYVDAFAGLLHGVRGLVQKATEHQGLQQFLLYQTSGLAAQLLLGALQVASTAEQGPGPLLLL